MATTDPMPPTIGVIIDNFAAALNALIGPAELAGVPWREGDAYDEWDAIASTLYKYLVGSALVSVREQSVEMPLAPYDMRLPDYSPYSEIVIGHPSQQLVFNSLRVVGDSFESIEAIPLDEAWRTPVSDPIVLERTHLRLGYLQRFADGSYAVDPTA